MGFLTDLIGGGGHVGYHDIGSGSGAMGEDGPTGDDRPSGRFLRWQAQNARDRAEYSAGADLYGSRRSGATGELQNDYGNMGGGPRRALELIRQARLGRLPDDPGLPNTTDRDQTMAALQTEQSDWDPYRQAATKFAEARTALRAADPEARAEMRPDVREARQQMRGERHLALAADRRGLSQAELAQRRPQRYQRLMSRTGRR